MPFKTHLYRGKGSKSYARLPIDSATRCRTKHCVELRRCNFASALLSHLEPTPRPAGCVGKAQLASPKPAAPAPTRVGCDAEADFDGPGVHSGADQVN